MVDYCAESDAAPNFHPDLQSEVVSPQEVSGAQAIHTRMIVLLTWLRGGWCCGCLLLDVVVDLPCVD
jgi:hypothetical protein